VGAAGGDDGAVGQVKQATGRRIGDIECLRGVAVLMVVMWHAHGALFGWPMPIWDHITNNYFATWPGVDLFFAISGFVIARSLLPSLRNATQPAVIVAAFWIRRVWRLFPSAFVWLAIIQIGCVVFNRSGVFGTFHTNFESALAGMLSVANFREAAAFGHFGYGPSGPYWSLSLEEQFYLLLPFTVLLAGRWLTTVLVVATLAVFVLPNEHWVMDFRVHAILLGVLLAIAEEHPLYQALSPTMFKRSPLLGLMFACAMVLAMSALAPYGQMIFLHPLDMIAVLCVLLVFVASQDGDVLFRPRIIKHPLTWIGTRSYAIYLVHLPAFCISREFLFRLLPAGHALAPSDTLPLATLTFATIVCLAELNYRILEVPLRLRGVSIARQLEDSFGI